MSVKILKSSIRKIRNTC